MKNVIILEFYGLPSIGKSTVSGELNEFCRERHIPCDNSFDNLYSSKSVVLKIRRIIFALLFVIKNYKTARKIIKLHCKEFTFKTAIHWNIYLLSLLHLYEIKGDGLHILSQGLVQYTISLKMRNPGINFLDVYKLISNQKRTVYTCYLKGSPETAINRMANREGFSILDRITDGRERKSKMQECYDLCELASSCLSNNNLIIDAEESISFERLLSLLNCNMREEA